MIRLLVDGTPEQSFPPIFDDRVCIDFRERDGYFASLFDLILTIHGVSFDDPGISVLRDSLQVRALGSPVGKGARLG